MSKNLMGWGLGLRAEHCLWILENLPTADWLEVRTEDFLGLGGKPRRTLEALRSNYPVTLQGSSLSIASEDPLDFVHLRKIKELNDWLIPEAISDHLCWSQWDNFNTYQLLPFPYTEDVLRNVILKVNQIQDYLERPIFLENPEFYLQYQASELSEAEFFSSLCSETGCKMLLNLNNILLNSRNLGIHPMGFQAEVGDEVVGQIRLGGNSLKKDFWDLYRKAVTRWPNCAVLVDWPEGSVEFDKPSKEVSLAKLIRNQEKLNPVQLELGLVCRSEGVPIQTLSHPECQFQDGFQGFQSQFVRWIQSSPESSTGSPGALSGIETLKSQGLMKPQEGILAYRKAYYRKVLATLLALYPTVLFLTQAEGFAALVKEFLVQCPPNQDCLKNSGEYFAVFLRSEPCRKLSSQRAAFVKGFRVSSSDLADLALLEWTRASLYGAVDDPASLAPGVIDHLSPEQWKRANFKFIDALSMISLGWDVGPLWNAVKEGGKLEGPISENCQYLVYRVNGSSDEAICHRKMERTEALLLEEMLTGQRFMRACETWASLDGCPVDLIIPRAKSYLSDWLRVKLVVRMYYE